MVNAIWTMDPDKALGHDIFPINLFWTFSIVLKKDWLRMLNWTRKKGKLGGGTNSSF